ncbi:hypothetical protein Nepgr_013097 [Nepenthes gracilis]|uniref:Lysine-specific demethylase ELF6 n=1 Tax=Nepenthes gracilis TaxID=150966 RepID=A0AAD3SIB3_NEPGR|nr:hypothetical protein Nepgr_013097 [Nepenthes gracilis]
MGSVDIPKWLEALPLAPEFRPTHTEFADPIAYISKIEKEVSAFGICKVIPPLPRPSKKYVFSNLNKSLSRGLELGLDVDLSALANSVKSAYESKGKDGQVRAVFTTRQQELGQNTKRIRGMGNLQQPASRKQVWQSGELYTLEQFEAKSKVFSQSVLGVAKEISPLVLETLFWTAASEKPIYVEYANDVPGSGFGEPEGSERRFHGRKRRRRIFARKYRKRSDFVQKGVNSMGNPCSGEGTDSPMLSVLNLTSESAPECIGIPTSLSGEASQLTNQGCEQSRSQVEGTAGWKLSNSPWNLQVISRSAGSLTRFMADDIPGVTSPMVYIGMLFSWFAWHVEDHELHSLNFLHTGSPKTWYAVPGHYAYAFEEAVRTQAFGDDVDRLDALTLLGEKTTLLSPELVVASGIPCCRLVQNPGEFVVTFPRAYHVGFSHGFNCGEAANFGTPQWLKVAKEAAVRRAAMDLLPMLSHQQLLYLLTMSFVSRVPRSLLPGVRSSRLRDRQKEERELLVKKAFLEDMLNENNRLNILLGRNSHVRAVLWDPDSLPSSKEPPPQFGHADNITASTNNEPSNQDKNNEDENNLFDQMISYAEAMNDLYLDDDLSCDFQADSGVLACVACGILGFPFLAVVQPSAKASKEIVSADQLLDPGAPEVSQSMKLESSDLHIANKDFVSVTKFDEGWNTSNGFLRPQIFCLEHAVHVEELLRPKGGSNVLVICHSDYPKIKANAAAVAEEIGAGFNYKEVTLGSASLEDLNLISVAIDDEEHAECREDWTSKLAINLRYCVNARKSSSSKQIEHALKLVGFFSNMAPTSNIFNIKWCVRRLRSKRELLNQKLQSNDDGIHVKNDQVVEGKSEGSMARNGEILFQYSRRKCKIKVGDSIGPRRDVGFSMKHQFEDITAPDCEETSGTGKDLSRYGCVGNVAADLGVCEMQPQVEATRNISENSIPREQAYSLSSVLSVVDGVKLKTDAQPCEEMKVEGDLCTSISNCSDVQQDSFNAKTTEKNEIWDDQNSGSPSTVIPCIGESVMEKENDMTDDYNQVDKAQNLISLDNSQVKSSGPVDGDSTMNDVGEFSDLTTCSAENVCALVPDKSCLNIVVCDHAASDDQVLQGTLGATQSCEDAPDPLTDNHASERIESSVNACSSRINGEPGKVGKSLKTASRNQNKRKRDMVLRNEDGINHDGFVKSPCEGLRPRRMKNDAAETLEKPLTKKVKKASGSSISHKQKAESAEGSYSCDLDSCRMHFVTKAELSLHKRNQCPYQGCRKRFRSHRYAVLHQRVHETVRPLKCTWEGCAMTFKWAWARTEHLRLHTGERPYQCKFEGCGLTFRFVSDLSRHRRKTGHRVDPPA